MSGRRGPIIAIDGPAASGKSTVAARVADRLGLELLDSGSMYRAVTLLALEDGADLSDERRLRELARSARKCFRVDRRDGGRPRVFLGDREVTDEIRYLEVGNAVSIVSAVSAVRLEMVGLQREVVGPAGAVAEGRDIGTSVFPDADMKIYLDADAAERARRRYVELREQGVDVKLEEVASEIGERDRIDSSRAASPLRMSPGSLRIDTTGMTIEQVVDTIVGGLKNSPGVTPGV